MLLCVYTSAVLAPNDRVGKSSGRRTEYIGGGAGRLKSFLQFGGYFIFLLYFSYTSAPLVFSPKNFVHSVSHAAYGLILKTLSNISNGSEKKKKNRSCETISIWVHYRDPDIMSIDAGL